MFLWAAKLPLSKNERKPINWKVWCRHLRELRQWVDILVSALRIFFPYVAQIEKGLATSGIQQEKIRNIHRNNRKLATEMWSWTSMIKKLKKLKNWQNISKRSRVCQYWSSWNNTANTTLLHPNMSCTKRIFAHICPHTTRNCQLVYLQALLRERLREPSSSSTPFNFMR